MTQSSQGATSVRILSSLFLSFPVVPTAGRLSRPSPQVGPGGVLVAQFHSFCASTDCHQPQIPSALVAQSKSAYAFVLQ